MRCSLIGSYLVSGAKRSVSSAKSARHPKPHTAPSSSLGVTLWDDAAIHLPSAARRPGSRAARCLSRSIVHKRKLDLKTLTARFLRPSPTTSSPQRAPRILHSATDGVLPTTNGSQLRLRTHQRRIEADQWPSILEAGALSSTLVRLRRTPDKG